MNMPSAKPRNPDWEEFYNQVSSTDKLLRKRKAGESVDEKATCARLNYSLGMHMWMKKIFLKCKEINTVDVRLMAPYKRRKGVVMRMEHMEGVSGSAAKISAYWPNLHLPFNNSMCLFCVAFYYVSYLQ